MICAVVLVAIAATRALADPREAGAPDDLYELDRDARGDEPGPRGDDAQVGAADAPARRAYESSGLRPARGRQRIPGVPAWTADLWWRLDVTPCDCDRDGLSRAFARAPSLADVVAAAQRAAGVAHDPSRSWRRRSRLAALVPWVTVRAGNSESWRDIADPTVSHAISFGGAVAWRLDRLVYDPNEPRFTTLDVARRRERRRVAQLASRAYLAWIEAHAAAERNAQRQVELAHAHADLDALTDGWFSESLAAASP